MTPSFSLLLASLLLAGPCPASDSGSGERERLVKSLIAEAELEMGNGNFVKAAEFADRAVAEFPEDDPQARNVRAKAFNVKAMAHNRMRQFEAAEQAARESIRQEPGNPAAFENLASAQLHMKRFQEAVDSATRAIELTADYNEKKGPGDSRRSPALAYYLRACAHEGWGAEPGAVLRDIREAARLSPTFDSYRLAAEKGGKIFASQAPREQASLPSLESSGPYAWLALALLILVCGVLALQLWSRETADSSALASSAARKMLEGAPAAFRGGGLLAGKYELTRVIGKGGMGEVWEARDQSLGRPVAVKRMTAALGALGPQAKEIYLKEAKTLASVHHPNVVDIYEILDLPDGMYLVFELMKGKTVQQLLVEKKRLPLALAKEILRPVCLALDWAHKHGIVHRDLKPSNIMVTEQGFVKVMDFGIARAEESGAGGTPTPGFADRRTPSKPRLIHTQTIGGTPAYMAPEAEQGIITAASDVYSLGVCLYEMLTDKLPFGLNGLAKSELSYQKASWHFPELGGQVDALIDAALQPNLEARIPSARQFLERLEKIPEPLSAT